MIDYKALTKDELIELLEVMRRNCISFEEEKERVRGTLGDLRAELERMEELDVMISLARDCIDYLNERIKEKE